METSTTEENVKDVSVRDTVIVTRKVRLFVDCDDQEQRTAYLRKLYDWHDHIYMGANLVLSHQYLLSQLREIPYLNEDTKIKIANATKDPDGVLSTSKMNTTYRVLSSYFKGKYPAAILSPLNQQLFKLFRSDSLAYSRGQRSLRTYKRGMPVPISGNQVKLANSETGREFKISFLQIPFITYLGRDRGDKRVLLEQALVGMVKICNCALKIVDGKLFLLLVLEVPKKVFELKPHVIAEANLGMEHPIGVNVGKQFLQIGNREEFLYRRLAIQSAVQRLQKAATYNAGGRGRKKKLKSLDKYRNKEHNYVESKLHLYSRKLIDFCVKQGAGTLLLVNQSAKEEVAKEDDFVLRNWGYYGLIEKIRYKAEMVGVNVIVE